MPIGAQNSKPNNYDNYNVSLKEIRKPSIVAILSSGSHERGIINLTLDIVQGMG